MMATSARALTLLALLRAAAPVSADEASALRGSRPAASTTSAGPRHFTVAAAPRRDRFLAAAKVSQKYHPVAVGDHECEGAMSVIESMEDCAAAAQILWPNGFQAPCVYPIWADNILKTDEPNEPYGCLALQNPGSHGCGLRWNPTGHEHDCKEHGLTCEVVCWKADEPTQLGMGVARSADKTTVDAEVDEEIELEEIEIEASVDNTTVDVNITTIDVNIAIDGNVTVPEGPNASMDKP